MFKVLDKIRVGNIYGVSIVGDTNLLKKGVKLVDEKGNIYFIESIAMTHYKNIEDYRTHAELVLNGDVEKIGSTLSITE